MDGEGWCRRYVSHVCRADGYGREGTETGRSTLSTVLSRGHRHGPHGRWEGVGTGFPEAGRGTFLSGPGIFIPEAKLNSGLLPVEPVPDGLGNQLTLSGFI